MKEVKLSVWIDNNEPITRAWPLARRDFRQACVRATPTEIGKPSSSRHTAADRAYSIARRTEEMRAASNIGKCLVDRDPASTRGVKSLSTAIAIRN